MDISSRKMWYLKNLQHCKENGWILITHEFLIRNFKEMQDSISDRFIEQFEMQRLSSEELNDLEQYYVPDEIFDSIESAAGGRTNALFELSTKPNRKLEESLRRIFVKIKERHPNEKIEGIFHCLEGYESLCRIARENSCPLINYSFSAFRKVHGYRQTLYFANIYDRFWSGNECKNRYHRFIEENRSSFPVLTNKELIALIGKEHTLPLIQLINSKPKYEMGVCCECYSILPQVFINSKYTDDDIFFECKRLYGSENLKVRSHAAHLNDIQIDRSEVHNDPVSTILSCKRVTAVQSQILLKSLLWGRTTITKTNSLGFSYLCDNDYQSDRIAEIQGLNYYIFGYLIPSDLMFSDQYWKWRLTNPYETEIYSLHQNTLLRTLGIDQIKLFSLSGEERLRYILDTRGCDDQLINDIVSDKIIDNINWDVASSQFDVITESGCKSFWRINTVKENGILSSKLVVNLKDVKAIKFYPLYDVAGFARLVKVRINTHDIILDKDMTSFKFLPKNNGFYFFDVEDQDKTRLDIECKWEYKKINEFLI